MTRHPTHSGAERRSSRFNMRCPHCGSRSLVRSSWEQTPVYREIRFECVNEACGHAWVAGLEAIRTVCPSATPNPTVRIPLAASLRAAVAQEQQHQAAAAG
jgi:hypothetical protein